MTIEKTLIPEGERLDFLPKYLGNQFLRFEMLAYHFMDRYCETYRGGLWHFYALSNGGMFICPDSADPFRVVNEVNYCDRVLSAEAAGIGVSLYALSHLAFDTQEPRLGTLYYALRDFAAEHPEGRGIFAFID